MTFEQFLESYGLEEDFQHSGMTPEEYLKSVFEEEPVKVHKCKGYGTRKQRRNINDKTIETKPKVHINTSHNKGKGSISIPQNCYMGSGTG